MLRNFCTVFRIIDTKFSTSSHSVTRGIINESIPTALETEVKLLKVAIIGVPNAGKSTFINNLMDRKVCPTSSKVHTTRANSMAIFTHYNTQIVFVDTPGLVNIKERKKYNLERSFSKDCPASLRHADYIGVVHDASNVYTRERLDMKIIRLLEEFQQTPSFLVLNKVDLIKSKRKLLDITRIVTEHCLEGKPVSSGAPFKKEEQEIRGWPYFKEVFMVSSLVGNGLEDVKNYLIRNAKPSEWMFPGEMWSDQTAEDVVVSSVKAKLLDYLPQEIPYELRPQMEFFHVNDEGAVTTVVLVHCPTEKMARLVAGVSDGKLRQITESLQKDLQDTFQNHVRVKLVLEWPGKQ